MKIVGTAMSMIRGDSESITVELQDKDGVRIPMIAGDTLYFTVKTSTTTETKILQKKITEFDDDGRAIIELLPEDTKTLRPARYVYDIQLTKADGEVRTLVPPSEFRLEGDVTHE